LQGNGYGWGHQESTIWPITLTASWSAHELLNHSPAYSVAFVLLVASIYEPPPTTCLWGKISGCTQLHGNGTLVNRFPEARLTSPCIIHNFRRNTMLQSVTLIVARATLCCKIFLRETDRIIIAHSDGSNSIVHVQSLVKTE
jgi:hypothetical protein